ncbi:MAG: hypothetical protein Q9209_002345 [Squamulea sp. 1 TL-2023]
MNLVKVLINAGADVNAAEEDGETPLHRALSIEGNYDTAKLLIQNGADLASIAVGDRTPLHAIFNGTMSQVLKCEEWMEDICPDSDGTSISHYLAWSSKTTVEAFERGRAHNTADMWASDRSGRNCLHYAASRGNIGVLAYLLKHASPLELEARDKHGCTAVHHAVKTTRTMTVIKMLLAKGANLYVTDLHCQNVLHHAARWSRLDIIQQLVALDPAHLFLAPDSNGNLPHDCTVRTDPYDAYEFLSRLCSPRETLEDMAGRSQAKRTPSWLWSSLADRSLKILRQTCEIELKALRNLVPLGLYSELIPSGIKKK